MAKRPDKPRGHRQPVPLAKQLDERTMPVPFCGCFIWMGGLTGRGYGKMTFEYKTLLAHRVAWELRHGPIADGLFVCHRCDEPSCVNPEHLFLGSAQHNSDDMVTKGRSKRGVNNPRSKLTAHDIRHIRRTDLRTKVLCDIYGVSDTAIKNIRAGRVWQHVQEV